MIRVLLFFLLSMMCIVSHAHSATVWVSTTGNDTTGNGSEGTPYKTIHRGYAQASAGDTIMVKNGVYTEFDNLRGIYLTKSGNSSNRYTIKSENLHGAIVDCNGVYWPERYSAFRVSADYITIDGFEIRDCKIAHTIYGSNIIIRNNYIHDNGNIHIVGESGYSPIYDRREETNNLYENNFIIHNGAFSYTGSDCGHGFYIESDNVIVRNNIVVDSACHGIQLAGYTTINNAKIYNNIFAMSGRSGMVIWQAMNIVDIKNNIFYENGRWGIEVSGTNNSGSGVVFDRNMFFGNTFEGINTDVINFSYTIGTNYTDDPEFVNDAGDENGFKIESTSPAIGSGLTLADVPLDFAGISRVGSPYDIGPHKFTASGGPDISSNLIAHYAFDGDVQSGTGAHHGAVVGSPSYVPGPISDAISLNGSSDAVSVTHATALSITGDMTISFWMYAETLPADTETMKIVMKEDAGTSNAAYVIEAHTDGSNTNLISYHHTSGQSFTSGLTFTGYNISPSTWAHVSFVRSLSAKTVSLYINGSFVETLTWTNDNPNSNTANMLIGYNGSAQHFDGVLDDMRIYARALSADDIDAIHALGSPPSEVGYTVLKTNFTMTLNGDLTEFTNANQIYMEGGNGNTSDIRMLWDDTNLYIGISTTDTELMSAITVADQNGIWNDDSIEFVFDTLNDGGFDTNDYKITINLHNTHYDTVNGTNKTWNGPYTSEVDLDGTLNDGANDTGYAIEIVLPWSSVSLTPQTSTPYGMNFMTNDDDTSGNTFYTWNGLINVVANAVDVLLSNTVADAPAGDTTPPSVPTGLTFDITTTSVALSWDASIDNAPGTITYRIEHCAGTGCEDWAQLDTTTLTTYDHEGLTPGSTHRYRIRAADAVPNVSDPSDFSEVTTQVVIIGVVFSSAPTALSATASSTVTFSDAPSNLSETANTNATFTGNPTALSETASSTVTFPGLPTNLGAE